MSTDIVEGAVDVDTSSGVTFPGSVLSKLNSTAWETWSFSGTGTRQPFASTDKPAAITIKFVRDATHLDITAKALRVEVDGVWEDGQRLQTVIHAEMSTVETCEQDGLSITKGRWIGPHANCWFEFRNEIGNEKERAEVEVRIRGVSFTGDRVEGTFKFDPDSENIARHQRFSDREGRRMGSYRAPMVESVGFDGILAEQIKAKVQVNDRTLKMRGIGGAEKRAALSTWDVPVCHWWWVRGVAGPYSFHLSKSVATKSEEAYVRAYLEENGQSVFSSTRQCESNHDTDCAIFTFQTTGLVSGNFDDSSTGFMIVYRSKDRSWEFDVDHAKIMAESSLGHSDQSTQFVDRVYGGEVGCMSPKRYFGAAMSEQHGIIRV